MLYGVLKGHHQAEGWREASGAGRITHFFRNRFLLPQFLPHGNQPIKAVDAAAPPRIPDRYAVTTRCRAVSACVRLAGLAACRAVDQQR
jgi:hypothetical protein